MRDANEEAVWGQAEKIGKGTRANYDPARKKITFCFNRSPDKSHGLLEKSRERLMQELKELGYVGNILKNGEVVVDNVAKEDLILEKKNHKLLIRLNNKQIKEKEQ